MPKYHYLSKSRDEKSVNITTMELCSDQNLFLSGIGPKAGQDEGHRASLQVGSGLPTLSHSHSPSPFPSISDSQATPIDLRPMLCGAWIPKQLEQGSHVAHSGCSSSHTACGASPRSSGSTPHIVPAPAGLGPILHTVPRLAGETVQSGMLGEGEGVCGLIQFMDWLHTMSTCYAPCGSDQTQG